MYIFLEKEKKYPSIINPYDNYYDYFGLGSNYKISILRYLYAQNNKSDIDYLNFLDD